VHLNIALTSLANCLTSASSKLPSSHKSDLLAAIAITKILNLNYLLKISIR